MKIFRPTRPPSGSKNFILCFLANMRYIRDCICTGYIRRRIYISLPAGKKDKSIYSKNQSINQPVLMPRLKRSGREKCFFSPYFLFRMKTVIFLDDKYTVHAMDIIFVFTQVSILQGTTCSTIQWPRCNFPKMNSWSLTRNNSTRLFSTANMPYCKIGPSFYI